MPPAAKTVNPIYTGGIGVYFALPEADKAIGFFEKVFLAKRKVILPLPNGKICHGELRFPDSNSCFYFCDLEMVTDPASLAKHKAGHDVYVYVKDVDAVVKRARAAKAEVTKEPEDQFWGDRCADIKDPWGNKWSIMQTKVEMTEADMIAAMAKFAAPPADDKKAKGGKKAASPSPKKAASPSPKKAPAADKKKAAAPAPAKKSSPAKKTSPKKAAGSAGKKKGKK